MSLLFFVFFVMGGVSAELKGATLARRQAAQQALIESVLKTIHPLDEKGFTRMGSPKPGEWLSIFPETPQTLEGYRIRSKIRPTPERRTIVLQPLGDFNPEGERLLKLLAAYGEAFFQLPVRMEKPWPLVGPFPAQKFIRQVTLGQRRDNYEKQYNADLILSGLLARAIPKDAVVFLGITMADLWSETLNFVFGLASFHERIGVFSLCRYMPEYWGERRKEGDEVQVLRRACKLFNHETGHMFGIDHCVFYRCSMNGTNSLAETDGAPIHYCPLCHRKLIWNLGCDARKRYGDLLVFFEKEKMKEEAEWMRDRMERWRELQLLLSSPGNQIEPE